jgi:acyl carrier protein
MKVTNNEVLAVIYECIDEVNRMLPVKLKLTKTAETALAGDGSNLDSLSLINLLVSIEEALKSKFNLECFLLDESLLSDSNGPYQSLGHLSEWITSSI